jgi:hypothetical protein
VTAASFFLRIAARSSALVLVAACARPAATQSPATSPSPAPHAETGTPSQGTGGGVLASFAAEPMIVLPVQTLRVAVPEWADKVGDARAYLSTVDDEFAFAIRDHGLKVQWAFPPDLARSARRNPGYTADPYALTLTPLPPVEHDPDKLIAEPLGGQLRTFTGLFNARYALVPVELALVPDPSGGRASLHVVIIDTRAARVMWKGDISSDGVRNFTPALAAGVAGRLADLFTPAR